ncbi:hypothetical protein HK096_006936, partial [Nowakowskiella sp. JEL0078]
MDSPWLLRHVKECGHQFHKNFHEVAPIYEPTLIVTPSFPSITDNNCRLTLFPRAIKGWEKTKFLESEIENKILMDFEGLNSDQGDILRRIVIRNNQTTRKLSIEYSRKHSSVSMSNGFASSENFLQFSTRLSTAQTKIYHSKEISEERELENANTFPEILVNDQLVTCERNHATKGEYYVDNNHLNEEFREVSFQTNFQENLNKDNRSRNEFKINIVRQSAPCMRNPLPNRPTTSAVPFRKTSISANATRKNLNNKSSEYFSASNDDFEDDSSDISTLVFPVEEPSEQTLAHHKFKLQEQHKNIKDITALIAKRRISAAALHTLGIDNIIHQHAPALLEKENNIVEENFYKFQTPPSQKFSQFAEYNNNPRIEDNQKKKSAVQKERAQIIESMKQ